MIDRDMEGNCVQGGSDPNCQRRMEPTSPRTASWQMGAQRDTTHQDDSGVASGSDCHSSSPGSDSYQQDDRIRFYSTPIIPTLYGINPYSHPLTPPTSEPLVSPKCEEEEKDSTLTPCASPNEDKSEHSHLKRLEMTLEKNLGMSSPRHSENSTDEFRSDNDVEDLDESLRTPKVNSQGKVKTFKCKQCDHVAHTKVDQWRHSAVHIREDKRLNCPKCPFVTEYKHHLEYHLRNHSGSKPFKCKDCDYTCVNKSMLNSHMKSHSAVYRFRCKDCNYASKYCHSLKLHLRRYGHSPNIVLDNDGRPDPDIIIDVYGSRRGPKTKTQPRSEDTRPLPQPFGLNILPGPSQALPFPAYSFLGGFPNPQLLQHMIRQQAIAATLASPPPSSSSAEQEAEPEDSVLDLSRPGCSGTQAKKSRRKGSSPCRMDTSAVEYEEDDDEEDTTTMFANVEAIVKKEEVGSGDNPTSDNNNNKEEKSCKYCNISFGDVVLYSIHMGHHGFQNPFTCNMCGVECSDRVTFFLHIAHAAHS